MATSGFLKKEQMMTRFWLFGCLALGLLAPTAPRAQPPSPTAPAAKAADKQAMYEDIEIMRRILNKQVGLVRVSVEDPTSVWYDSLSHWGAYTVPGTQVQRYAATVDPSGWWLVPHVSNTIQYAQLADSYFWPAASYYGGLQHIVREGSNFEGAYLKGHGVVYTGSVPAANIAGLEPPPRSVGLVSLCSSCHEAVSIRKLVEPAAEPAREEPSLWEKVRREVRGVKDEPAPKRPERVQRQDICTPGALAELILETLAQNGHNFRALPATEGISVIVTVPGVAAPASDSAAKRKEKGEASTAVRTAKQLLDLADLHTKQGKSDEAAKTLADAIKRLADQPLSYSHDTPYDALAKDLLEAKQLLRSAYTKQAQLLLAAGRLKEAREALDKAESATLVVNAQEKPVVTPSGDKAPPALPAKLVVTVSKKLLDEVHAGKLDLPAFKKGAEVEAIGFPPAAKAKK
jgi:hypothetical protein